MYKNFVPAMKFANVLLFCFVSFLSVTIFSVEDFSSRDKTEVMHLLVAMQKNIHAVNKRLNAIDIILADYDKKMIDLHKNQRLLKKLIKQNQKNIKKIDEQIDKTVAEILAVIDESVKRLNYKIVEHRHAIVNSDLNVDGMDAELLRQVTSTFTSTPRDAKTFSPLKLVKKENANKK